MVTFNVDSVIANKFETRYAKPGFDKRIVTGLVGTGVEASSIGEDNYLSTSHNLISAINTAYDGHYPYDFRSSSERLP